jgi:hypothetical protein
MLQRRPVLLLVVAAVAAVFGAKFGNGHSFFGLWDGPI